MKNGSLTNAAIAGEKFRTFEDLEVYQAARQFRKAMYAASRRLPEIERFGLASQIRRAAVSLTNNIAEGHGRYHYADQLRFLLQARGSLEELIDDLNVCLDESYLTAAEIEERKTEGWSVLRLINGYGRYLRSRKQDATVSVHESTIPYRSDAADLPDGTDPFNDLTL